MGSITESVQELTTHQREGHTFGLGVLGNERGVNLAEGYPLNFAPLDHLALTLGDGRVPVVDGGEELPGEGEADIVNVESTPLLIPVPVGTVLDVETAPRGGSEGQTGGLVEADQVIFTVVGYYPEDSSRVPDVRTIAAGSIVESAEGGQDSRLRFVHEPALGLGEVFEDGREELGAKVECYRLLTPRASVGIDVRAVQLCEKP